MAEDGQVPAVSAAFPAPPPFYASFTAENNERIHQHQGSAEALIPDITALPPELRNLIPPPLPHDGKYYSFSTLHDINPPPSTTHPATIQPHLLALTHKLLLTFLDITNVLSIDPALKNWSPKWETMDVTFQEIHKAINEYRPHQARETLIEMMTNRIAEIANETQKVRHSVDGANATIEQLQKGNLKKGDKVVQTGGASNENEARATANCGKKEERDKRLWRAISEELGTLGG